jgi:beta-phosphoglucomutase
MALRAIIFDLDGTLADTESLHLEAFNAVLRPDGIDIPAADYFARLIGYNDHDCLSLLLREHRRPAGDARIGELVARKAELYQGMISHRDVLFPGAAEFVRRAAERFPLALVTGTLRAEAEMVLRNAGIRELFVGLTAAEDVSCGKPEPDGFMAALGRLGFILRPRPSLVARECLVIEDTPAGIEAAARAGMRVLAVCNTNAPDRLAAAELVRPSLAETDLDEVLRILAASG